MGETSRSDPGDTSTPGVAESSRPDGDRASGPDRGGLKDQEPFATIRAFPRRFAWGVPAVFIVSIGLGMVFAGRSLSLGIAVQLFIQTVGLLWLYVPALRRRLREDERT